MVDEVALFKFDDVGKINLNAPCDPADVWALNFGRGTGPQIFLLSKHASNSPLRHESKISKEELLAQIQTHGIVGVAKEECVG